MHIGILTDYPVVPFTCGPALATQALKRYLEQRGHRVTIVGPRPGKEDPAPLPGSVLLNAVDFGAHPGVRVPFPWPPQAFSDKPQFDVIHSHANSLLMHWAPMMRELHGIPCLSTNTIYLPAFAQHLLPDKIYNFEQLRNLWAGLSGAVEASFARVYNAGDGLIVQCEGLASYWRKKGLDVPLHVIPRPIDVRIFDRALGDDPFRADFPAGYRLITVGRHAREKDIDKVLKAFARHVLPRFPQASLTLVGDGLEHQALMDLARELGVLQRCDFAGEKAHRDLRDYYGHADIFAYASMSETYGQVISEALWSRVPVVAVDDKMGVAFQVAHGEDGLLVPHDARHGDQGGDVDSLGRALVQLAEDTELRQRFGARAAERARQRVAPDKVYAAYEGAYAAAIDHIQRHPPKRRSLSSPLGLLHHTHRHLIPWTWKHAAMCAVGAFRGAEGYSLPKGVKLDAPPEPGPFAAGVVAASGEVASDTKSSSRVAAG